MQPNLSTSFRACTTVDGADEHLATIIRWQRSGLRTRACIRPGAPSPRPWLPDSTVRYLDGSQRVNHGRHRCASPDPCSCCAPARLAPSGAELVPPLSVAPGELVLVKKRFSAFLHTHLDLVLRCGGGGMGTHLHLDLALGCGFGHAHNLMHTCAAYTASTHSDLVLGCETEHTSD